MKIRIAVDVTCTLVVNRHLKDFLKQIPDTNDGYLVCLFSHDILEEFSVDNRYDILNKTLPASSGVLIKPVLDWSAGNTVYVLTDGYFPEDYMPSNIRFYKDSLEENAKNLLTDNLL